MNDPTVSLAGKQVFPGLVLDFGSLSVSEDEIIAFARVSDPLYFHVDKAAAAASHFGGIIASGSQLFSEFHKRHWIPAFGNTVIAGLAIQNWVFHKPHYPDQEVKGMIEVIQVIPKPERGLAVVHWRYRFLDPAGELMQSAEFQVMHKPDPS